MGKHDDVKNRHTESLDIYSSSKGKKKSKKKKAVRKKKIIIILLSVLLAICILIGGALIYAVNLFKYNRTDVDENQLGAVTENSEDHIVNIALFGLDTRKANSTKGLSDSIMVLSVNKKDNQIKIISIMRDSVVKVDGTLAKVNSAYSKGGAELAIKTLNQNFALDITDYATVNFGGMADMIDIVGGVECEVTQGEIDNQFYGINTLIKEISDISGVKPKYVTKPGKQTLNGIQAVSWARIRMVATAWGERDDFGRTARQRRVLEQLFKKATNMSITQYPDLIKSFMPHLETSLTYTEIIGLAPAIKGSTMQNARLPVDNSRIPGDGGVAGGVYYNLDYAQKLIKAFVYDDVSFETYVSQNEIDKTPWR